jgi:hypothetical protein
MTSLLINNATPIDNLSWTEQRQVISKVDVDGVGNVAEDGNSYIQVTGVSIGVSGRNAPRTVALGIWDSSLSLIANTANFSISASTSARPTEIQTLESPLLINTTTETSINAGFWSLGTQAVYYQRGLADAGTNDIIFDSEVTTEISNFTNSGTLNFDNTLIGSLEYITVPAEVNYVSAFAGNTNVTLNWEPPFSDGGSPITSYTVERATNSTFTSGVVTFTGVTGRSTVVTGLTNGTNYFFRVAAVNVVSEAAGTSGQYSYDEFFPTQATPTSPAAPAAPSNVIVTPGPELSIITAGKDPRDALLVQWTAPANNGATITSYIVYLQEFEGKGIEIETRNTDTSLLVRGLTTNFTYQVKVSARNSVGVGAPSDPVSQKPLMLGFDQEGLIKKYSAQYEGWIYVV